MSSSKVNFPLSPNLRLARRGSATPVECTEKKSPLRRGSWSPNLRLLRRSSDSNAVKDSQSLVRTSVFLRPSFVPFCFVTNARALSMETFYFGFVCLSCCNRNFCFFSFFFLKRNSQVTTQFSPTLQRCHSGCVSCLQRVCFIFRMNFTLTKFFYCSMDESSSCTTAATSVQIWVSISLCSMWYEISYFFNHANDLPFMYFVFPVSCLMPKSCQNCCPLVIQTCIANSVGLACWSQEHVVSCEFNTSPCCHWFHFCWQSRKTIFSPDET